MANQALVGKLKSMIDKNLEKMTRDEMSIFLRLLKQEKKRRKGKKKKK